MTTIALIEDNRLLREGLTTTLGAEGDLEVVYAGLPPPELGRFRDLRPEVTLLEARLSGHACLRVARDLFRAFPGTRILVLNRPSDDALVTKLTDAGVYGFLDPDASFRELLSALHTVAGVQRTRWSPDPRSPFATQGRAALTPREREVAGLVAEGLSNHQIARRLSISPHTVKSHVRGIMRKWDVRSRVQIAILL